MFVLTKIDHAPHWYPSREKLLEQNQAAHGLSW